MNEDLLQAAASLVATQADTPPPEPVTALGMLEQVLFEHDYDTLLEPADELRGPETLYAAMGEIDGHLLLMKFVSLLDADPPAPEQDPQPDILHGTLILPFDIAPNRVQAASRAVHKANRFMPLGAYCLSMDEDGGAVCYLQTSLMLEPAADFPVAGAQALADMTSWALTTFAPMIAAVVQNPDMSIIDYLADRGMSLLPVRTVKVPVPVPEEE